MFVQAGSSSIVKQTLFNARPMPPIGGSINFELLNGSPRDCYEVGFVRHYFSGPAIRWLLPGSTPDEQPGGIAVWVCLALCQMRSYMDSTMGMVGVKVGLPLPCVLVWVLFQGPAIRWLLPGFGPDDSPCLASCQMFSPAACPFAFAWP